MTSVGLVGGLGPESTIDYYRRILEGWQRERPGTSPSMVIDSLDVQYGLRLVGTDRLGLVQYLLGSLRRLAGAGVDFVAIAANTPHIVFDELAALSPVPLVSIVEVCADEAQRRGLRRLGLLGTGFTMGASFYPEVFGRRGMMVVTTNADERPWLDDRYIAELLVGNFRDETRDGVLAIVRRLASAEAIDGIILGGTELPLLLGDPVLSGLPTLDTTALHVEAIVSRLLDAGRAE